MREMVMDKKETETDGYGRDGSLRSEN